MIRIENECVQCGLPCIYESCQYFRVIRCYCDNCKSESDTLYHWDSEEWCIDCIVNKLEEVEYDE